MNLALLERLVQTAGIAGREHRFRRLILSEIDGLFDEVRVDPMGSVIGLRRPRPAKKATKPKAGDKPTRVMLAAHMDQIGFMVRHIDERGFVRVNPVGGFDTRNLFARVVRVCPDVEDPVKDLLGVMNPAGKPTHISSEAEKSKVPDITEFAIDLGLPVDQVKQKVRIGDMAVLATRFDRVGETIVGQALDNRIAAWVCIESLRKIRHHDAEIHCVFTVQEEVGLRGAGTSSHTIEPDIAVSVDTTLAVDTPGVPDDQRVSKQGDGAGILVMDSSMISDLGLVEDFDRVAKERKIKAQRTILPRGGNDGATIQVKNAGRRVIALVCPVRYIHTVTEMAAVEDLAACRDLLTAYLEQV